jgi:hypothetical protein
MCDQLSTSDYPQSLFEENLDFFVRVRKTPNILFHGPTCSNKHDIVNTFVARLYKNNQQNIQKFVMNVDCSYGKGIKFIRDELKFFAKTHIRVTDELLFKSVILLNADKLTVDAQSALRRCIEQFSHTTRFFMIVDDKCQVLKPILSRFCEIYIPELQTNIVCDVYDIAKSVKRYLRTHLKVDCSIDDIQIHASKMYELGYSGIDLLNVLKSPQSFSHISSFKKCEMLVFFNHVRKEIRHETIFITIILHFIYLSSDKNLTNVCFM